MYSKYIPEQIDEVLNLFKAGENQCQISRKTKIPRNTLRAWIKNGGLNRKVYYPITDFEKYLNTEEKQSAYSFILAVYLCDGHIYTTVRGTPQLRCTNDMKYPEDTKEWIRKLKIILPNNKVSCVKRKDANCNVVLVCSKLLFDLFPQQGIGKKHQRPIILKEWQQRIIEKFPEQFVRGCFQSDGSIYSSNQGNYLYKRYGFVNKSRDIMNLFLKCLKLSTGIEITPQKKKTGCLVIETESKKNRVLLEPIISCKN